MAIDITPITVQTWDEFVRMATAEFAGRWQFRGTLDNWELQPSLERAADQWSIPLSDLPDLERRLIREFKRAYPPNASVPAPPREDDLAWLALMQHHGAPTRLLDWTYSPFVAAFFALEVLLISREESRMAAVWALAGEPVNNHAIRSMLPNDRLKDLFDTYSREREGPAFRAVFMDADPRVALVSPANPWRLNERLVIQKGLFMCPGDIGRRFDENLDAVKSATDPMHLRKIQLPREVLREAFTFLSRVNISRATLFPGVDGYAQRLRHEIGFLSGVGLHDSTGY